jgi:hypothetical protein
MTLNTTITTEVYLIAFDQLWKQDIATIQDQLWTIKALTEPDYRLALEMVIEARCEGNQAKHR